MTVQRASWRTMTTGQGDWLESWRKKGEILLVLHKQGPLMRHIHNFRQVKKEETKDGVKLKILWLPWVCHESDAYHRDRRMDKDVSATICPGCRLVEYFEKRRDLKDDMVIFSFKGSGRDQHNIELIDFVGYGEKRDSYKDDFTAVQEYLIPVISPIGIGEKPELKVTNEKWSHTKRIQERIEDDIKHLGEDLGDPSKKPIAYLWKAKDRGSEVSRFGEAKITDEVRRLWDGPAPDSEADCLPSDPNLLLDQIRIGLVESLHDEVPIPEIFGPALEAWAARSKEEKGTDFDPAKLEGESEAAPTTRRRRGAKADAPADKGPTEAERLAAEPAPTPDPPATTTTKRTRPVKAAPPPPPEPKVEIFTCEGCGADWPENLPNCPNCNASSEGAAAAPPPPPPKTETKAAPASGAPARKPNW